MNLTGSGDAPSLGFAAPISDVSKHSDKSGEVRWGEGPCHSVFGSWMKEDQAQFEQTEIK